MLGRLDRVAFSAVNDLAGRWAFADAAFVDLSRLGPFLLAGALCVAWFLPRGGRLRERNQRIAILTAFGAAAALVFNQLLILFAWRRPRPFVVQAAHLLLPPSKDPSFPSDHATFSLAVAVGLLFCSKRIGIAALVVAALVGLSRVFVGEHYPTDVLGGALIGAAATLAVVRAQRPLEPLLSRVIRFARRLGLS